MKNIVIFFLTLLIITNAKSQTNCTLKIVFSVNKTNPPSYTFKTEPQTEGAKYRWSFSDNVVMELVSPTREFKVSGNYVTEVTVTKTDGTKCSGRLEARFEGSSTSSVLYASGKVVEQTGCGLVIVPENTATLVPAELPQGVTLKPGTVVELAYELAPDKKSECGTVIKVLRIAEIVQNTCNVPIQITKVANSPGTYQFKTAEQPAGTKYYWYFGELGKSDSPSPLFTFNNKGVYKITLKVEDASGKICTNAVSETFEGKNPVVLTAKGKVVEKTGCGLVIVPENATILVPAELPQGVTLKPGTVVELAYELVPDKKSECGTVIKVLRIAEIVQNACNVPIQITKVANSPGTYQFKTAEQPAGTKYYWYFGELGVSDTPAPVFTFKTGGAYKITIKALDTAGKVCTNTVSANFEGNTTPVLYAKGKVKKQDATGCEYVVVLENGTILIPVKMAPGFQLKQDQYVELSYEKLPEKVSACREGTDIKVITIKEINVTPSCKAYFTAAVSTAVAANSSSGKVVFTNQSTGELKECLWNFGDNTTSASTEKTVTHEYAAPGEYKVCLVITTTSGCKSDFCFAVKIGASSECKFDAVAKPKEEGSKTYLFATVSQSEIKSWKWSFGDGKISEEKSPEHTYEKSGVYEATCTIVTTAGCTATRTVKINVAETVLPICKGPVSLVLFDPVDKKCNGKAIVKLLSENGEAMTNVKYIWSHGNSGSVAEMLCPDKTYMVQAVVEGVCQKFTSFAMLSKPLWRVTSANGTNIFSVLEPKEGVEYVWDLGNGKTLKGAEINFEFEKEGIYNVKLTAVSGTNSSEFSQQVIVMKNVTGTTVLTKKDIRIFPNPAKDVLKVNFGNPVDKAMVAEIVSVTGRKVLTQRMAPTGLDLAEIDIRSLNRGMYFLRINDGNQNIFMHKFIKE